MSAAPKPKRRLPWKGSTLIVFAFLLVTILPAFVAFVLTPPDAQVVTSVEGWNGCVYTMRRGDNLFRIGVHYGVSYHYIAQMNGIYNPNYVWAGQVITVPCGAVTHEVYKDYGGGGKYRPISHKIYKPYQCPWCQPFDIPQECAMNIATYTVVAGDNLFRIATAFGSTIQWIRTENNMWGKVLRPGMILTIPCVGYVKYGPNVWTPTPGQGIITATPLYPTLIPTVVPADNIRMNGGRFRPPRRDVRVGTTVTWINNEPAGGPVYTVTSGINGEPNGRFNSGPIAPGGTFIFTFSEAGSYPYYSETDPTGMTGEVIVAP